MIRSGYILLSLLLLGMVSCNNGVPGEEEIKEILMSKDWQYDVHNIWMEVDQYDLGVNKRNSLDQTFDMLAGGFFRFEADSVLLIQPKESEAVRGRWYLANHGKALALEPTVHIMPPQMFREIGENGFVLEVDNNNGYFFPKIFIPFQEEE